MQRSEKYHRDDLRAEMLVAGRDHLDRHGHAGLSVRALALKVGVSPGAPYYHFPDRRALLLALALDGYDRLNAAGLAVADAHRAPMDNLAALGRSFLTFCADNPRLFELMYESELTQPAPDPRIAAAQDAGFDMVQAAMAEMQPHADPSQRRRDVIAFWSTLYGYAALTTKGMLDRYMPDDATEVATAMVAGVVAGFHPGTAISC